MEIIRKTRKKYSRRSHAGAKPTDMGMSSPPMFDHNLMGGSRIAPKQIDLNGNEARNSEHKFVRELFEFLRTSKGRCQTYRVTGSFPYPNVVGLAKSLSGHQVILDVATDECARTARITGSHMTGGIEWTIVIDHSQKSHLKWDFYVHDMPAYVLFRADVSGTSFDQFFDDVS